MDEMFLLNALLESIHDGVVMVDSRGVVIKCNRRLEHMLGLAAADITGLPVDAILPGLDCNREISNYRMKNSNKELIVRTAAAEAGGDRCRVLFISDKPFSIELGNRYAELKLTKDMYESILNSIDEGIHVADAGGNIIFINPSQKEMDGLDDTVMGKSWKEVYNLDESTSLVLQSLKEGKSFYDVYQNYVTGRGKYVSVVCSSIPLYQEGKLIGAAAITKDFPKFREMAEKILQFHEGPGVPGRAKVKGNKRDTSYTFEQIIGKNKRLHECIEWGRAGARSDSAVLIYGETGTGKEMFAQSIHAAGGRSGGPFLAINCAAIPGNLLEGILFGTAKGAFTGSVDRAGLIELAGGGTFFLDEINAMPVELQSKLLRVVEEKKIMRLGGKEKIPVDLRIISSCNIEPSIAIEKGQLRDDLFYRLAVVYIHIPPLRERLDDLEILTGYFIEKYNAEMLKGVTGVSAEVMEMFRRYSWPGNVRQLAHCIECAMNLVQFGDRLIKIGHIPRYLLDLRQGQGGPAPPPLGAAEGEKKGAPAAPAPGLGAGGSIFEEIQKQEKEKILLALRKTGGNISRAAAALGMSRQRLYYRLKKYNFR